MPKICYVKKRFKAEAQRIIRQVNQIVLAYQADGYTLTLRQIYYQFVAHDFFPDDRTWTQVGKKWVRDPNGTKNAEPNYKWLGDIIGDARLAGLIDWNAIEDRTRNLRELAHWDTPESIVDACAKQFKIDHWDNQKYRPEVWIEKDALVGVIENVCQKYDVPFYSCRGYTSQSEMWGAGQRMLRHIENGQCPVIFHLGDHDPSGIDMSRDIRDRLAMFCGTEIMVHRVALNMDQIKKYNPPPNPAKMTDSRANDYVKTFGNKSWELDALEPKVIVALIERYVKKLVDDANWEIKADKESEGRSQLKKVVKKWEEVISL